jgi:hypothetical protein
MIQIAFKKEKLDFRKKREKGIPFSLFWPEGQRASRLALHPQAQSSSLSRRQAQP